MLKIGINGFGRIGRLVLRALLEKNETDLKVLAINDLGSLEQNIHLLKYDTVHGMLPFETYSKDNIANIGDQEIKFYNKRSPNEIPWEDHGIDIVLECTGIFTKAEDAKKHLKGSVKKVLISAPASNADITVVFGCGGERDKSKRKKMGKIVNSLCDKIIVTDDNPRREKPKLIRKAIIKHIKKEKVVEVGNRTLWLQ